MTRRIFLLLPQISTDYYAARHDERMRLWKKFADLMNTWVREQNAGQVRADEVTLFTKADAAWRKFLRYRVY